MLFNGAVLRELQAAHETNFCDGTRERHAVVCIFEFMVWNMKCVWNACVCVCVC